MYVNPNITTNLSRDAISTRKQSYQTKTKSLIKTNESEIKQISKNILEKKNEKNVIVLTDNKNHAKDFYKCLGI